MKLRYTDRSKDDVELRFVLYEKQIGIVVCIVGVVE